MLIHIIFENIQESCSVFHEYRKTQNLGDARLILTGYTVH
jgi:hypothetical protein